MNPFLKYLLFAVYLVAVFILVWFLNQDVVNDTTTSVKQDTNTASGKAASSKTTEAKKGETKNTTEDDTVNVDEMTDEEKEEAIQEAMEEEKFVEMTEEEKEKEVEEVEEIMKKETIIVELLGDFKDRAHAGSGVASIVNDNGDLQLMLSDRFATDPGPNLHVYISAHHDPMKSTDVHDGGDADLGKLKSTSGTQLYDIPDDIDFEIGSVVIYCVPFKVIFTVAGLQ